MLYSIIDCTAYDDDPDWVRALPDAPYTPFLERVHQAKEWSLRHKDRVRDVPRPLLTGAMPPITSKPPPPPPPKEEARQDLLRDVSRKAADRHRDVATVPYPMFEAALLNENLVAVLSTAALRLGIFALFSDMLTGVEESTKVLKRAFTCAVSSLEVEVDWTAVWSGKNFPRLDLVEVAILSKKVQYPDKARPCRSLSGQTKCTRGPDCKFAHTMEEYKPIRCPMEALCGGRPGCLCLHHKEGPVELLARLGVSFPTPFQRKPDEELRGSKVCRQVLEKGKCFRQSCSFAHSEKEFNPVPCCRGEGCRFRQKDCAFIHPKETKAEVLRRIGAGRLLKQ